MTTRSKLTKTEKHTQGEQKIWSRKDLLDTADLKQEEYDLIFETSEAMLEVRERPVARTTTLRGMTLATLFYENSTRTRASFELAGKALGADVVNLDASQSSVEKGESLIDTVRTLEAIGTDLLVLRHPLSGAATLASKYTNASVINAGDGMHAHPTQALLDLFTIKQHLKTIAGRKIAIVGDVLHSRVARSNIWALQTLGAEIAICGPATLLPKYFDELKREGHSIFISTQLQPALKNADVVMTLRLQKERQSTGIIPSLSEYIKNYQINRETIAFANPNAIVMHPGPVNVGLEITQEIAQGPQSVINSQVANGVSVRMALLYLFATRSIETIV